MNIGLSIYLIDVLSSLDLFCGSILNIIKLFLLLSGTVGTFLYIFFFEEFGSLISKNSLNVFRKNKKGIIISLTICISASILIPSKEDMYMMLVSSYITKENYNWTKGEIKDIFNEINSGVTDIIKTIKED